jgi:GT2 family glycosyltransferase
MLKIAVLIACHNRKKKTIKCLQKLYAQKNIENIKFKVFLVDDGSSDGTEHAISQSFPDVVIIKGNGNLFWARSMALAWEESLKNIKKFDYFLWLNDDTYLYDKALSELIKTQINKTEIAVGSVCDPITKKRTYGGWRFTNRYLRPFKFNIVDVNSEIQKIDIFNGNVVLIPYLVYRKIGVIDNFFKHAYADIEYSLRAKKNGIIILLANKYLGECSGRTFNYEDYQKKSLFKKISNIFDHKNVPLRDWFRMTYKYGGLFWPLHFFIGYIKSIIKILYNHKYIDIN